jgi:hypothetical protein
LSSYINVPKDITVSIKRLFIPAGGVNGGGTISVTDLLVLGQATLFPRWKDVAVGPRFIKSSGGPTTLKSLKSAQITDGQDLNVAQSKAKLLNAAGSVMEFTGVSCLVSGGQYVIGEETRNEEE